MTDDAVSTRIKSFVSRIGRLEEEKRELSADIKEIYAEAKATGFDVPTIRKLVALERQDAEKRKEAMLLLETYSKAIQMDLFP